MQEQAKPEEKITHYVRPKPLPPDYKTIEGLIVHPLWITLTYRQQRFVLEYIGNGKDKMKAAKAAYKCKNDKAAEDQGGRILRMVFVRKLLAAFYDYELEAMPMSRQEYVALVATRMRDPNTKAGDFATLAKMMADLRDWDKPKKKPKPEAEIEVPEPVVEPEKPLEPEPDLDALIIKIEQERKGK